MEYTYEINSIKKTIIVRTKGELITTEVAVMGLEVLLKAKELKYKVMFDCRLSKNKMSITDAYFWYSINYDNIDKELRFIPIAYIANKEDWYFFSFFECTCNNKGIRIKVFQDESAAYEWFNSF